MSLCATLFLSALVLLSVGVQATDVLRLVEGNCTEVSRLTCPLAFGFAESVCPPKVLNSADPCVGAQSSCCPSLDFSSPLVSLQVSEFVIDSVRNPFAPMSIVLSGQATVRYDANNRVLALQAGQTLTFSAPVTAPFCLFSLSSRALGDSRLRVLGAGRSVDIITNQLQAFYQETDVSSICQAPEFTLLNQGANDVLVQLIDLCLISAKLDQCGVCNGQCGTTKSSTGSNPLVLPDGVIVTDAPRKAVKPHRNCNRQMGNDVCLTWWGFENDNDEAVEIPINEYQNRFDTAPWNRGQPTIFPPGRYDFVFYETHTCIKHKEVLEYWKLNTTTLHHGFQERRAWSMYVLDDCKDSQMPPA